MVAMQWQQRILAVSRLGQTETAEQIRLRSNLDLGRIIQTAREAPSYRKISWFSDQEEVEGRDSKSQQQKRSEAIVHLSLQAYRQLPQMSRYSPQWVVLFPGPPFYAFPGCYGSVAVWSHCCFFLCPTLEATFWIPHLVFSVSPSLRAEAGKNTKQRIWVITGDCFVGKPAALLGKSQWSLEMWTSLSHNLSLP